MSSYDNVVGGKLRLKGKALDVKAEGMKKKKKHKKNYDQVGSVKGTELTSDGNTGMSGNNADEDDDLGGDGNDRVTGDGRGSAAATATGYEVHLTPAEKRYMEQKEQIDVHKLAKTANKSHRDRIQDFNQYLANMSEHYDIPKVGPG